MKWRVYAGIVLLSSAVAGTACGKKNNETGDNNTTGTNNTASNNSTGTNNGPNNQNNTNGSNNGSNNNTIPPMPAEFGLDDRPSNTTCLAFDRPPSASNVTTERSFQDVSFSNPIWAQQSPSAGDDRWFVVEQPGRIVTFANDPATGDTADFIDIRNQVNDGPNEAGLLGMAFHPDWPATPDVYLSYTRGGNLESVVSRFSSTDGGTTLDPSTEAEIFSVPQPFGNHNGGQVSFGPDRHLYFALGDGGSGGDPLGSGQDTSTTLGSILRLDVLGGEEPYGIPADNPFANGGGAPEIYAYGLRNPWRFSFDVETGDLWAGDVGQGNWEEVSLIERGGNYGWNVYEGTHCYQPPDGQQTCPEDGPWIMPVVEYDHSQGRRSITGGYVYRGTAIPELNGIYIFADYVSGHVYGIFEDDQTGEPEMRELFQHGGPISSFAQDQNGEVYLVDYSGSLHRIVADGTATTSNFPNQLSDTGCMDPNDVQEPAAGLVPYTVNAPFWSDDAVKEGGRYLALPDDTTITVEANGDWSFPMGTVIVKNFWLEGTLIETRLMVHHEDGDWGGYSYEWNDEGTEATYVRGGKTKQIGSQNWIFPSSGDCLACHTQAAGRTLGLQNVQLDGDFTYESTNRLSNQIATLDHIGMFDSAPDPDAIDELVHPFGEADETERARSYLHTNCTPCHVSGTAIRPKFDLSARLNPLIDDELCNADPVGSDLGVAGAKRLVPGDPDNSLLWLRMNRRDANGMPPLATNLVDEEGAALVRAWIAGLSDCEL